MNKVTAEFIAQSNTVLRNVKADYYSIAPPRSDRWAKMVNQAHPGGRYRPFSKELMTIQSNMAAQGFRIAQIVKATEGGYQLRSGTNLSDPFSGLRLVFPTPKEVIQFAKSWHEEAPHNRELYLQGSRLAQDFRRQPRATYKGVTGPSVRCALGKKTPTHERICSQSIFLGSENGVDAYFKPGNIVHKVVVRFGEQGDKSQSREIGDLVINVRNLPKGSPLHFGARAYLNARTQLADQLDKTNTPVDALV